ncbi:MAG: serine protease [Tannerellaceae bacterium]|nr:serine protease [Tannerellaceae bacterium]
MKKLILLLLPACFTLPVAAQKAPKWMDKSRKAVLTVTTFDKNDRPVGSTAGFFVSETGEALSAYSPFNGAARATVADIDGNTYPVTAIIGADDLYDVIRFKVAVPKKVAFLPLATDPTPVDAPVYLISDPGAKEIKFRQGAVTEVSKLKDPYNYYKVSIPVEKTETNLPLFLSTGHVFALAQEDASGKKDHSYGVSATYVKGLMLATADIFNTVYTRIGIRKVWSEDAEQAAIALFLQAGAQDAPTYLATLQDFIDTFPGATDGYLSRASHYVGKRTELASDDVGRQALLDLALADIDKALLLAKNKGEVYYQQAKLIYSVAAADTAAAVAGNQWKISSALLAIHNALREEDQPAYREMEGDIYFFMNEFPSAYESYMKVNATTSASAESYYMAAKSLENVPGAQISDLILLLDSAIVRMGDPLPREAAPYVLERVDHKIQLALYAEALADYDLYYALMDGQVNDSFYFYREQARSRAGDNDGALQDIRQAIVLNPQAPDYYAEQAAIQVRMQNYDEALASIDKALELAPGFAACYRIRGVCFIRSEKKPEACEAFAKARELGDPLVTRLIREHCNP